MKHCLLIGAKLVLYNYDLNFNIWQLFNPIHNISSYQSYHHEFLLYLIINKLWYDVRNDKGVWINFDLKESFIINHIMCINYGTDRLNPHEMKFTAYLMSVSWFQNETKAAEWMTKSVSFTITAEAWIMSINRVWFHVDLSNNPALWK